MGPFVFIHKKGFGFYDFLQLTYPAFKGKIQDKP